MQLALGVNHNKGSRVPIYDPGGSLDIKRNFIVAHVTHSFAIEVFGASGRTERLPRIHRMKIIDLSRPIYDGMPVFPGDPKVQIEILGEPEEDNGLVRRISLGSHSGTHVDAFGHMHRDGDCLGEIPLERFLGPARAVRPDEMLPQGVGLIFIEAPTLEDAPRIAAAGPPFVAGDLPAELERLLLARQILTYTDLVNLNQLPEGAEFTFYGLPLSIAGGDGSPVRAVAIIP